MPKEVDKEQILHLPLWFLQVEDKYYRYRSSLLFYILYVVIGIYALIPLFPDSGYNLENLILFYIIFVCGSILILWFFWRRYTKPFKVSREDRLAYKFYRLGFNLDKTIADRNIKPRIKNNTFDIAKELRKIKRTFKPTLNPKLAKAIRVSLKNIEKLDNFTQDTVYNFLNQIKFSMDFYKIGEKLHTTQEIPSIQQELKVLSENLEKIPEVKLIDRVEIYKELFADNFFFIGIIIMALSLLCAIQFTQHQVIFASIFSVTLGVWLTSIVKRN